MKALGVQRLLVFVLCNIVVATPHQTGQPHTHSHLTRQQQQQHRQQNNGQQGVVVGNQQQHEQDHQQTQQPQHNPTTAQHPLHQQQQQIHQQINNQHLIRQQQQQRQQNFGQQGVVAGNRQQHEQDHQQTQQPQQNPTVTQQPQHQQQQQTHPQQNNQQPQQPSPQQQQQQQQQPLIHQQQPQQHQDHVDHIAGDVKFPNDEALLPANATANEVHEGRESQCNELPDPGECRGAFPRYYFNTKNDQCDCFLYGGCDDDPNITEPGRSSWFTLDACVQSCKPSKKEKGPSCKQLSSPGSSSGNSTSKPVGVADTSHLSDEDFLNILQP